MKRKKKYNPNKITAHAPVIVGMETNGTELQLTEYQSMLAFTLGYATKEHFDVLTQMTNILYIAGHAQGKEGAKTFCDMVALPTLSAIKARFDAKGRLGVNSDELNALKRTIEFNKAFWQVQSGELYAKCVNEVNAFYGDLEKNAA
jgi:hypothetical protein